METIMDKCMASLQLTPPGVQQETRTVLICTATGHASVPIIRANASSGAGNSIIGSSKAQRCNRVEEVKVCFRVAHAGEPQLVFVLICKV